MPDPTSQGRGRYSYAYNSPIKYTDPTGHVPFVQDPNQTNRAPGQASEMQTIDETRYDWWGRLTKLGGDLVDMAADTAEFVVESLLPPSSKAPKAVAPQDKALKEVVSQEICGPEQFAPVMTLKDFSILTFGMVTPKVPGGAGDDLGRAASRGLRKSKITRSPGLPDTRKKLGQMELDPEMSAQADGLMKELENLVVQRKGAVTLPDSVPHRVAVNVQHRWRNRGSDFTTKHAFNVTSFDGLNLLEKKGGRDVIFVHRTRLPNGKPLKREYKVFEAWTPDEIHEVRQTFRKERGS